MYELPCSPSVFRRLFLCVYDDIAIYTGPFLSIGVREGTRNTTGVMRNKGRQRRNTRSFKKISISSVSGNMSGILGASQCCSTNLAFACYIL